MPPLRPPIARTTRANADPATAQAAAPLQLSAELWLSIDGKGIAGDRRFALLEAIHQLGSLTHAAKAVGLSYKGAWDAVEQMNNLSGVPLLDRSAGGKGGGSTLLTERGRQLLKNFRLIQQEHQRFIARLNSQADGLHHDFLLLESFNMKTSARNQFAGTVSSIRAGAVNDEVELDVIGGLKIAATITHESCVELGLAVGKHATALVKASSVVIVTEVGNARFSARNQLTGQVSRVMPGAVNTEVVIELPGGGSVAAIVTNESAQSLALAAGKQATAMFKVSSVILAVMG